MTDNTQRIADALEAIAKALTTIAHPIIKSTPNGEWTIGQDEWVIARLDQRLRWSVNYKGQIILESPIDFERRTGIKL